MQIITGGPGADRIIISHDTNEAVLVLSGSGSDTIQGGYSYDDTVVGGAGDDFIQHAFVAVFTGPRSDYDILWESSGAVTVVDHVAGRDGRDFIASAVNLKFADVQLNWLDYANAFQFGTPGDDTLVGSGRAETISGVGGNDVILGGQYGDYLQTGDGNDSIDGGAGSDRIVAFAGSDTLYGGTGDDYFELGPGVDYVDGGEGRDLANFGYLTHALYIDANAGVVAIDEGNDTLVGIESFGGSAYADTMVGTSGGSWNFFGNGGPDSITTGSGNDILNGGSGDDTLSGGAGNDTFLAGNGNDVLHGGEGLDQATLNANVFDATATRQTYTITHTGETWTVARVGAEATNTDTLDGVERLRLSDFRVALDIDGAAGDMARLLGALAGADAVQNRAYVAIGLSLFDAGWNEQQVAQAAAAAVYSGASNEQFVAQVFENVIHLAPDAHWTNTLTQLLTNGMSRGDFLVLAAHTSYNESSIDLVGISQHGLDYAL